MAKVKYMYCGNCGRLNPISAEACDTCKSPDISIKQINSTEKKFLHSDNTLSDTPEEGYVPYEEPKKEEPKVEIKEPDVVIKTETKEDTPMFFCQRCSAMRAKNSRGRCSMCGGPVTNKAPEEATPKVEAKPVVKEEPKVEVKEEPKVVIAPKVVVEETKPAPTPKPEVKEAPKVEMIRVIECPKCHKRYTARKAKCECGAFIMSLDWIVVPKDEKLEATKTEPKVAPAPKPEVKKEEVIPPTAPKATPEKVPAEYYISINHLTFDVDLDKDGIFHIGAYFQDYLDDLKDEETGVSKVISGRHCIIRKVGSEYFLEEEKYHASTNGTYIDGKKAEVGKRYKLEDGATFYIARQAVVFHKH